MSFAAIGRDADPRLDGASTMSDVPLRTLTVRRGREHG